MEFKPPSSVSFTTGNVAENWRRWQQQFEIFYLAAELSTKAPATQVAILLHCAGPEAQDVHRNFTFSALEDKDSYKEVLKKFKDYCEPRKNECFERYKFWQKNQHESESVDQWVTELRLLLTNCDFDCEQCACTHVSERILRDKILFGVADSRIQERLLREADLNLKRTLEICHAAEASKQQIAAMSGEGVKDMHPLSRQKSRYQQNRYTGDRSQTKDEQKNVQPSSNMVKDCRFCGASHEKRQCKAYGQICNKCQGRNHFSSVCKGGGFRRQVYTLEDEAGNKGAASDGIAENNNLFLGSLEIGAISKEERWHENVDICGLIVNAKLDTGAEGNVVPLSVYIKMIQAPTLQKTNTILRAYGDTDIKPLGVVSLPCKTSKGVQSEQVFYVTSSGKPILGQDAVTELGLVKRLYMLSKAVGVTKPDIEENYKDIFTGLGNYEQEYHIKLKPDAKGVIQAPHRVPYAIQPKLKEVLKKLTKDGIIADVDGPTEWVNNLVVAEKKSGQLRICLDPKPLNSAIMREQYAIPTPGDVQAKLSGKRIFTVVDMKDAYWHVRLSEESSFLCTFSTPWGRKRFKRMPFGISSASEVMQKRNDETFGDINGVHVIADDLIIAAATETEHDATLIKVLDRARQKGVRFNKEKIQFKVPEVKYMGNIVSHEGLRADKAKVEAITNMPQPDGVQALQRLLGMIKYLAQYIQNESSLTARLRQLLKKDAVWEWQPEHDAAFNKKKSCSCQFTHTSLL